MEVRSTDMELMAQYNPRDHPRKFRQLFFPSQYYDGKEAKLAVALEHFSHRELQQM